MSILKSPKIRARHTPHFHRRAEAQNFLRGTKTCRVLVVKQVIIMAVDTATMHTCNMCAASTSSLVGSSLGPINVLLPICSLHIARLADDISERSRAALCYWRIHSGLADLAKARLLHRTAVILRRLCLCIEAAEADELHEVAVEATASDELEAGQVAEHTADAGPVNAEVAAQEVGGDCPHDHACDASAGSDQELVPVCVGRGRKTGSYDGGLMSRVWWRLSWLKVLPLTVIVVSVPGIPAATLNRRVTAAGSLPVLSNAVRERGEQRDAAAEDGSGLADEAGRAVPEAGEHGQEPAGGKHVGNEEELQHVERLCTAGGGGRETEGKKRRVRRGRSYEWNT